VDTTTRLAHPAGKLDPTGLDTSDQLACGTELTSILATDTLGLPENLCTLWRVQLTNVPAGGATFLRPPGQPSFAATKHPARSNGDPTTRISPSDSEPCRASTPAPGERHCGPSRAQERRVHLC